MPPPLTKTSNGSRQGVDRVVKIALELIESLRAHIARCTTAVAGVGEGFNVCIGGKTQGAVHLTCSCNAPLIERTGTTNDEAIVDQAQIVAEIAVALVDLHLAITGFTGLAKVGVLVEASITSFAGDIVQTGGQLFSSLQTSSSSLNICLLYTSPSPRD